MIITLCGSGKFEQQYKEWNEKLSLAGHCVFSLAVYPSDKGGEKDWYTDEQKEQLDAVHMKKIDESNSVVILNVGGYIGESTKEELDYARQQGKDVFWLEASPLQTEDEALAIQIIDPDAGEEEDDDYEGGYNGDETD